MTNADTLVSVGPDDTLEECGLVMSEMSLSALPVIHSGEFLGVVSLEVLIRVRVRVRVRGSREYLAPCANSSVCMLLSQGINKYIWASIVGGKDTFVRHVMPRRGGKTLLASIQPS